MRVWVKRVQVITTSYEFWQSAEERNSVNYMEGGKMVLSQKISQTTREVGAVRLASEVEIAALGGRIK